VTYAIISDIHGNLEALEAVKTEIGEVSPGKILCLGDIVGYGASPNECIEVTKGLASVTVAGNHDFGVTGQTDISYFNYYARQAIIWTARAIKSEYSEYLRQLPLSHIEDNHFRIVHATPSEPGKWNYIFNHQQALREFKSFAERVCFIGHSHQACIFEMMDEETIIVNSDHIKIADGRRYIINVGSVGQPRDGDPRACLCVYDEDKGEAVIKRVAYDVDAAKRRILDAQLPPVLANRLSWGE
jgi:diadenosine tetraphosphatase ApaH/serine/threonine PP2A family protein phosphatase